MASYTSQPGKVQPGLFWPGSLENLTVAASSTDSGSGTDSQTLAVALNSPDTGSGTEAQTLAVSLTKTDSGSGSESQSVAVTLTSADSGSGAESWSIVVTLSSSDSGSGTDTGSINSPVSSSDSGTGTEDQSIAVTLSDTDSGTGTDSESLNVTRTSADSATGADSQTVDTGSGLKSSSDIGNASETQSIAVSSTDSGTGTDTSRIGVSSTDAGSGADSQSLVVNQTRTDSALGSELESTTATLSSADTSTTTETSHITSDWSDPAVGVTLGSTSLASMLVQGPATIYIGSFGATEPLDTLIGSVPSSVDWTDLGSTLGGVKITLKQDYEESDDIVQAEEKVNSRLKKRSVTAELDLAEPTLDNFVYLLNNGTTATGAGYKNFTPSATLDSATVLTYRAIIIDGWAPGFKTNGQHKRRRIILRKCLSIGDVSFAYTEDKQTTQSVTWAAHRVDGVIQPVKIIDET